MKNQALFSSKDKSKKLKCCLLQFLFGVLMINSIVVLISCVLNSGILLYACFRNSD